MFGTMDWGKLAKAVTATLLMVLLILSPIATPAAIAAWGRKQSARTEAPSPAKLAGKLSEVAPPATIQALRQAFDDNQPQVTIQSPRPNEVLTDDHVSVQFQVKDLTLFKDKALDLGPHLEVILDDQPYQEVYDLTKPLSLEKLAPGTHTIRVFAARPWHESFKNEGAYAQTTFHVFTKTGRHSPDPNLPLLTYSQPQGTYGAEPVMLDFYLTNAPLHLVAQEDKKDDITDWRIRCTVNGDSFVLEQWQPIYLKGFKPGKNWVQLEFLDENGNVVENEFNNTAQLITYAAGGKDTLAKLVRGDLSAAEAQGIVNANYQPPVPTPTPSPTPKATPETKPTVNPTPVLVPVAPVTKATPKPDPSVSPLPVVKPSPVSQPTPRPSPKVEATPEPKELPKAASKSTTAPEAIAPVPSPKPEAKPAKSPVKDFMSRFKREKAEKSIPIVKPAVSPAPASVKSPEPVAVPKSVEIIPKSETIDRPKLAEPAEVIPPKLESPKLETSKPVTSVPKVQPALSPKPSVTPEVVVTPKPIAPPVIKSTPLSEPTPTVNGGRSETQAAEDLKAKVSSQFDKWRDRLRQVTTPKPTPPKSTPSMAKPAPAESTLVTPTVETDATPTTETRKFPVISVPQPSQTSLERSPNSPRSQVETKTVSPQNDFDS